MDSSRSAILILHGIDASDERLAEACRKWKVKELSLFGSILRRDLRPDSDVDVRVVFLSDAPWSLWDLFDMPEELQRLFGREVDWIENDALRNPFRRHEILQNHQVIYAA